MRPILLACLVSACAMPQIDAPDASQIARSDYPRLVPFDDVLDQRVDTSRVSPEATAALQARAEGLQRRELGSAPTGNLSARAARLRARAEAMR